MATARAIHQAYDSVLSPHDLNINTASTLAYVAINGPVTQTVLAAGLGVGRAAAGTYVDRLEQRKLVERLADVDDRRVWLVSATDSGQQLAQLVVSIDERLRTRLRRGIDRSERQALARVLIRLQENLEDTLPPESPLDADNGPEPTNPTDIPRVNVNQSTQETQS